MRKLELDYRRGKSSTRWPGFALLTCSLAVAIVTGVQHQQLAEASEQAQASLEKINVAQRRRVAAKNAEIDTAQLERDMRRAQLAATALKQPWIDLFTSVEAANLPNVALLSIESDSDKRQLKISAEAKDMESMLDYVRTLSAQPKLASTFLLSHQVQQQDPLHPVRFVLAARWALASLPNPGATP
jgi:hypothetical protein